MKRLLKKIGSYINLSDYDLDKVRKMKVGEIKELYQQMNKEYEDLVTEYIDYFDYICEIYDDLMSEKEKTEKIDYIPEILEIKISLRAEHELRDFPKEYVDIVLDTLTYHR